MNTLKVFVIVAIVTFLCIPDSEEGLRIRRRRRRRCTPQHCAKSWGQWSACNCIGKRKRIERVTRAASCGGSCSIRTEKRSCSNGVCRFPFGVCNLGNKQCKCSSGYTGRQCEKTCQPGTYGRGCRGKCNCHTTSRSCDPRTGYCLCPIGRYGYQCKSTHSVRRDLYKYYHLNTNTACYVQERVVTRASDAISICPLETHYAVKCSCGGHSSAYNLFFGQSCQCLKHVLYSTKFVVRAVCCPRHRRP